MRNITEAKVIAPRLINPKIPRDLETIILKAIAANPANRFRNCGELADDLKRFTDGRPILSRPVTRVERLWRWAKRYPALATATATSASLLFLVAIVTTLGYRAEYEQRQRAETTTAYALEALDTVFDRYALNQHSSAFLNEATVSTPVLSQESAQMLDGLLPIFDRLAELDNESDAVRMRAIDARGRVGDIQQRLGQFDQAILSYRQAASSYETKSENTIEQVLRLSDIYNNIGTCEIMLGRINESRASHETALKHLDSVAEGMTAEVTYQLARTHFFLIRRLRPGEGPNDVNQFPPHGPPPPGGPPHGPPPPRGAPEVPDEDWQHLDAAIALIESLGKDFELDPHFQHLLAMCLEGRVPDQFSGRSPEEQSFEDRALAILKKLADLYPTVSEYHHAYVDVLARLDTRHHEALYSEDLAAVESRLRLAILYGEDLVAIHPYIPDYTLTLIHAHNKLGHVLEHQSRQHQPPKAVSFLNDALTAYLSAEKLQSALAKRFPDADAYQIWQREFERSALYVRDRLKGM